MPICDPTTIENNVVAAAGLGPYAPVRVRVLRSNANPASIEFEALGVDDELHTFPAAWGDRTQMWAACPSTVSSDGTAVPVEGTVGTLYLSETYMTQNAIAGPTPKWPKNLADDTDYRPLTIIPRKLVLTGVLAGPDPDPPKIEVNLLDSRYARLGQTLLVTDDSVELQLSDAGFEKFGASLLFADALETSAKPEVVMAPRGSGALIVHLTPEPVLEILVPERVPASWLATVLCEFAKARA